MKKYLGILSLLVLAGLMTVAPALVLADTTNAQGTPPVWANGNPGGKGMPRVGANMMKPGIVGIVSAVSGNTLTVNGKTGFGFGGGFGENGKNKPTNTSATTTYSVDATNAKVTKNNAASTVSTIAVGDTVMVQGTITGTNVVATMIRDGVMPGRGAIGDKPGTGQKTPDQNPLSTITGNGQPVVAGTIASISGSTLTVTNKSNVTYTVDATNAKIFQGKNATATLANVKVGDNVVVQGTVNGTSVTASTVIDQPVLVTTGTPVKPHVGFFAGIGQFFGHLFGF